MKNIKGWLVVGLILLALISFSSVDYIPKHSIYNNSWNGTSKLHNQLTENLNLSVSRLLISPFALKSKPDIDMMVIIGSERSYAAAEVTAYRQFVEDGGNLIIFEDFGQARDISRSMGITFFPGMLKERKPALTMNRPSQFFIRDIVSQIFFGQQINLYLMVSEAAVISDLQGLRTGTTFPILVTFPSAFLDTNNNNQIEAEDLKSEHGLPVGFLKTVGDGFLTVISDSSIPLNQYWNRKVELQGQLFALHNAFWTSVYLATMASFSNTTSIIFDESHQELILTSTSGILNLGASIWVGLLNSGFFVFNLFLFIVAFGIFINKDNFKKLMKNFKRVEDIEVAKNEQFISNPTLSERAISEQYILYQKMGDGFVQIANSELINSIKQTKASDGFLKELEEKYGPLDQPRKLSDLLKIHKELRDFVDSEIRKRL